jgi:hypothetical protein
MEWLRQKTKSVVWILIAIASLALVGWLFETGRMAVALAKGHARAAGMPTKFEEIIPPHVPDADNAAPLIARFVPQLNELRLRTLSELSWKTNLIGVIAHDRQNRRFIRFTFFPLSSVRKTLRIGMAFREDDPWWVEERKRALTGRAWVTAQLDSPAALAVLAVIREAAAKRGYDPHVAWMEGSLPRWPDDEGQIAEAATLLSETALLAADQGKMEDACTDVWAMFRLADFLANEPVLSRQRNRLRILQTAVEDLEEIAATGKLPPTWNLKFAGKLASMNLAGDLARDLSAAGLMGGKFYFEGILSGRISFPIIVRPPSESWVFPSNMGDQLRYWQLHNLVRREYSLYIDWHTQVSTAIAEPCISLKALIQRLHDADARITPDRIIPSTLLPATHPGPLPVPWGLSSEWSPSNIGDVITATWWLRTKIAIAQVGLALERYRVDKGDYPSALDTLVPEYLPAVPTNIFTGNPLHYEHSPGAAAVVGEDAYYSDLPTAAWLAAKTAENVFWGQTNETRTQ